MSLCNSFSAAADINYCGANPYGSGTLRVGEVANNVTDVIVEIEHAATGYTYQIDNGGVLPLVEVDLPPTLSPGAYYYVRVYQSTNGTTWVQRGWKPYVPSNSGPVIHGQNVDAVRFKAVAKNGIAGDQTTAPIQWIIV